MPSHSLPARPHASSGAIQVLLGATREAKSMNIATNIKSKI